MLYALWNQLVVLIAKARARLLEGALVGVVNAKRHRANWEIKHICHVFICTSLQLPYEFWNAKLLPAGGPANFIQLFYSTNSFDFLGASDRVMFWGNYATKYWPFVQFNLTVYWIMVLLLFQIYNGIIKYLFINILWPGHLSTSRAAVCSIHLISKRQAFVCSWNYASKKRLFAQFILIEFKFYSLLQFEAIFVERSRNHLPVGKPNGFDLLTLLCFLALAFIFLDGFFFVCVLNVCVRFIRTCFILMWKNLTMMRPSNSYFNAKKGHSKTIWISC